MKYMLLINNSQEVWEDLATWPPEDLKSSVGYMNDLLKELTDAGELVGGQGLGGPARLKVVRAQPGGDPLVTDGPMAEAKEFLAGYLEVDVASEERAIEIAARVSAAPGKGGVSNHAPIEVHPVMDAPDIEPELLAPYKKR
jgi:hypothetical protein